MIPGGSTIYLIDAQRPSQVLPMRIDSYASHGERADLLAYDDQSEKIIPAPVEMIQLVSNEEDIVMIELEGGVKLRLQSTILVMTSHGFQLADMLIPPMEVLGLPRGTELYDQFLFVYPKPSLYRVLKPAKAAGVERMFSVSTPASCCVIDGMIVKTTEID